MRRDEQATSEDVSLRSATFTDMHRALRSLSAEHRVVLVHVYFRGMSVNRAAEVLGIPAAAVVSRTYYAMRALKDAVQACGAEA
ncbi:MULTISPECIES: sigma factor-like helix-turn-helix DNA-binding protein [Streptomyces]|uniref:sigma factor-like helix-turn-helix DNA-binding protein n=1 Tax=Streptomyces TaxID=1883 RepID=UPI00069070BF|nr:MULTISPECIES: sigma factor-like helix-turn-helix DNA-binding protein [Streptomyces]